MSTINLFKSGWKEPKRCYMLGYMRELWLEKNHNMVFKDNRVLLVCSSSSDQLYFLESSRNRGGVRSLDVRGLDSLQSKYRGFHFGVSPKYRGFDKEFPMVRVGHPVPRSGEVEVIGPCHRIDYFSKKENKDIEYKHTHKKPFPVVCINRVDNQLFYVGGKYYTEDAGIID